jgi:ferrochelatase
MAQPPEPYDALLVVSFGGPEGLDDVLPFLENVTRGRGVPAKRLREVAEHYHAFGGVSPINRHNRALIAALERRFAADGPRLPIYWGNRNWHPFLAETVRRMAADGIRRALAFVTSAYSSYSGCRQYLEDIERARMAAGERAPLVEKIRAFWNHPGFITTVALRTAEAVASAGEDADGEAVRVVFTAHSLPVAAAARCDYEAQVREAATLVAERLDPPRRWEIAFQSRSGPPTEPWLEPDIVHRLAALRAEGVRAVVVVPIGFVTDHMEVVWDLDTEAAGEARALGLRFVRAATVGTAPEFVETVRDLVLERLHGRPPAWVGTLGPRIVPCAPGCCPLPVAARRGV